jgi:dolichol-phosphate mannosyltransferase
LLLLLSGHLGAWDFAMIALVAVNAALLVVRLLLAGATAHSFAPRGLAYWLAPLADLPAVLRVIATMVRTPREWRGQIREIAPA